MSSFVPILDFENDYEILNEYPYTIRRKNDKYEIKEYYDNNGYVRIVLNQRKYLKHVIIAKQFITNDDPDNKTQVDHINRNRTDYHIENLRWVSSSENNKNRIGTKNIIYEYVDDLPDEAIVVDEYANHEFENYFYYDDCFYFYNGIQYRKLYKNTKKGGLIYSNLNDVNNKKINVFFNKFKRERDLM